MKTFILSAIILFVATVNGAPRGVDPSEDVAGVSNLESLRYSPVVDVKMDVNSASEGLASVEPVSKRRLFDILKRSYDFPSDTKRMDFNLQKRNWGYESISKREEAVPTIGADIEGDFDGNSVGQLHFEDLAPVANRMQERSVGYVGDLSPFIKHLFGMPNENYIHIDHPTEKPLVEEEEKKPGNKPFKTVEPLADK